MSYFASFEGRMGFGTPNLTYWLSLSLHIFPLICTITPHGKDNGALLYRIVRLYGLTRFSALSILRYAFNGGVCYLLPLVCGARWE
jgi:hypothetical protein